VHSHAKVCGVVRCIHDMHPLSNCETCYMVVNNCCMLLSSEHNPYVAVQAFL